MKTTTRKLSGPAKDRFFKRFFAEESALDADTAERLAEKSSATFSSVRVRKGLRIRPSAPYAQRPLKASQTPKKTPPKPERTPTEDDAPDIARTVAPSPSPSPSGSPSQSSDVNATQTSDTASDAVSPTSDLPSAGADPHSAQTLAQPAGPDDESGFDPFAFGIIPTLQREGEEGLRAHLAEIANIDHLRETAKAQQIVLPRELRKGDIPAETIRDAIVTAAIKRIADRRTAAGDVKR